MSIDRLRYFAAVVETKNLRRASELVGISPPSMSKAISVLENELNCKLTFPDGRGIGITPKGLDVYRSSSLLLEEYRRFHQRLKQQTDSIEQTRIGTFEVFSSYFMSSFFRMYQDFDVLLLEMTPGKIEQAIIAGSINLGITYLPNPDPSLEYREIGTFKMGLYGQRKWESEPFSSWPFAVPTTELQINSSEIEGLDMWPRTAPKRKVKFKFQLLETALQTSMNGLSVVHCPSFIIQINNSHVKSSLQLSELTLPNGYKPIKPVKTYLVGRKGGIPDDIERKFAKFMRSLN